MLPSKQCLLLTIENVNKPPKNIEKSEYFGFTLQFEYLANVSQKEVSLVVWHQMIVLRKIMFFTL